MVYASKHLNETQKGYAQIEKKNNGYYFYLLEISYGKNFLVKSGHKPLETIFKKKPLN